MSALDDFSLATPMEYHPSALACQMENGGPELSLEERALAPRGRR